MPADDAVLFRGQPRAVAVVRADEELAEEYRRMIYAESQALAEKARALLVKKWWLWCPPGIASFEEAGDEFFTSWKALRMEKAPERNNEKFRRRTVARAQRKARRRVATELLDLVNLSTQATTPRLPAGSKVE